MKPILVILLILTAISMFMCEYIAFDPNRDQATRIFFFVGSLEALWVANSLFNRIDIRKKEDDR